jgi:hypothetical protein
LTNVLKSNDIRIKQIWRVATHPEWHVHPKLTPLWQLVRDKNPKSQKKTKNTNCCENKDLDTFLPSKVGRGEEEGGGAH